MDSRRGMIFELGPILALMGLVLVACLRSEPTVPLPHEMPPLETAVPRQVPPVTHSLLSPTDLGDGWRGEACPTRQPFFCLYEGQEDRAVASLSFSVFPLVSNQIMPGLLEAEGLALGHTPQLDDDDYIQSARAVLTGLAETNIARATQDAAVGHSVVPLARQPVEIGPLPGLAIGHMVQDEGGAVVNYVRYYAAFDGDVMYWLALLPGETADLPNTETVASQMAPLETAATALLSQLQLPPAVVASEVEQVRVEWRVALTAVLGEGVIQLLHGGETFTVRGLSEDGNWWYVDCPEGNLATSCWLPNDTGLVRPR
jgi:hypothetical protein